MLELLRKNANSWLMMLLLGIIIFVFAINFGPWAGRIDKTPTYAARVDGQVIPATDFQAHYANQFRMMQQFRPGYTEEQAERDGIKKYVLDQLISTQLLASSAQRNGLVISDEILAEEIRKRFTKDNESFDREQYKRIVNGVYNTTENLFEKSLRNEMSARYMATILGAGPFVTQEDLKEAFNEKYNKVALDVVKIDPTFFNVKVLPTDIDSFMANNKNKIEEYYQQNLKSYRKPKEVHAFHILKKVKADATEEEKNTARAAIEKARKRIVEDKEDFSKVAKEVSDDSTAATGGDLGFFGPDIMDKQFTDVAFKLKEKEISEIVETPFGFHIIMASEIRLPVHKELKDVEREIATNLTMASLQEQEAQNFAKKAIERLKTGVPLEKLNVPMLVDESKAGDTKNPRYFTTGLFSENSTYIPKIGQNDDLHANAFSLAGEKAVSDKVYSGKNALFVIRVKERERPKEEVFEKEKDSLRASLIGMRSRQFMSEYVKQFKSKASIRLNDALGVSSLDFE